MLTILLVVWLTLALLVEGIVDSTPAPFVKTWKKVLFTVVTLPSRWVTWIKALLPKFLGVTLVTHLVTWFKS